MPQTQRGAMPPSGERSFSRGWCGVSVVVVCVPSSTPHLFPPSSLSHPSPVFTLFPCPFSQDSGRSLPVDAEMLG